MAASTSPRARLLHIRDEIEGVAAVVKGAVLRTQIVSEAAKALPQDLQAKHSGVPWVSIIGLGNVLRHEYQRLDDKLL